MNARLLCAGPDGRGTVAFLRAWAARTPVPLRGDAILFGRDGKASAALSSAWRAAFARSINTDEPLIARGLPTKAFLDEARGVNL